MSIRWRLTLWYSFLLSIMLLGFAAGTYVGGTYLLQTNADCQLRAAARLLADAVARGDEQAGVGIAYRVLGLNGVLQFASGLPARQVPIVPAALQAARRGQTYEESLSYDPAPTSAAGGAKRGTLELRVLTSPVGNPPQAILQVGQVMRDAAGFRALLLAVLLGVLALGLPLAALGGWWLAGRALAPIHAMTAAARRIEAADLTERLPRSDRKDELSELAATFNQLLDRLQSAFQHERRFTADVSHDLRTPLALIKSTVGVALNRPRPAEELQGALQQVETQVDGVAGLLDAILFLSRADGAVLARGYQALNLSELLADLHETTAAFALEEHGQELGCRVEPELWVCGDRDQLTRLHLNLLDNAMQYTPRGGSIQLSARSQADQVIVEVVDNGVGIAPEDLPHVFERFYRADQARAGTEKGHHGLGLSIAQAIARSHGGTITVTSTLGLGTSFCVSLPRGGRIGACQPAEAPVGAPANHS